MESCCKSEAEVGVALPDGVATVVSCRVAAEVIPMIEGVTSGVARAAPGVRGRVQDDGGRCDQRAWTRSLYM